MEILHAFEQALIQSGLLEPFFAPEFGQWAQDQLFRPGQGTTVEKPGLMPQILESLRAISSHWGGADMTGTGDENAHGKRVDDRSEGI